MLNKTIKFLKNEFEKQKVTEPKDKFYLTTWAEKADFTKFLMFEFTCYLDTILNRNGSDNLRKALNKNRQIISKSIQEDSKDNFCVGMDESQNIALLKLLLAAKYEPPIDNLGALQVHIQPRFSIRRFQPDW